MAKGQSPLLGYNTNVRHKGRVFHIQTEDSGVAHPHVITHLFADGGRILKSNKTSYADLLDAADMQTQVKKIMQDQHKAMFIALRDGQFDHLIDPDSTQGTPAYQTGKFAAQPGAGAPAPVRPPTPVGEVAPGTPAPPGRAAVPPPMPVTAARPATPAAAVTPAGAPPARPSAANLAPRATPAAATPAAGAPGENTARTSVAPGASASQPPSSRSGRYAPVRAPEILGSFKPKPESTSIFGDGLMSEKSLDEVILAYLADDLDDTKR